MATYRLTEALRVRLKEPLGDLIRGSIEECNEILKRIVEAEKPARVILVGDTISRNAVLYGIAADVIIVDNKEKRGPSSNFEYPSRQVITVLNTPGTIQEPAWTAIRTAVNRGNYLVKVDGEEDLLVLVAIAVAPLESLVAYGQPDAGIVIVRVSAVKKNEVDEFLRGMKVRSTTSSP